MTAVHASGGAAERTAHPRDCVVWSGRAGMDAPRCRTHAGRLRRRLGRARNSTLGSGRGAASLSRARRVPGLCARLPPARYRPGGAASLDPRDAIRWTDLAAAHGVRLFPDISFSEVLGDDARDQEILDDMAPADGRLVPEACAVLAELLRAHTSTPERLRYCIWEGNGAFWSYAHTEIAAEAETAAERSLRRRAAEEQDRFLQSTPKVHTRLGDCFLFHGPLDAARRFEPDGWHVSPNLWWPADRAWVVITHIEGYSTYVAASRAAIDDILASQLEAIEITRDVHLDPNAFPPVWR